MTAFKRIFAAIIAVYVALRLHRRSEQSHPRESQKNPISLPRLPPAFPAPTLDFSAVDIRSFKEAPRRSAPAYILGSLGGAFTVLEDSPQPSTVREALHAQLIGKDGQHFGCFLSHYDGAYACPEAARLSAGEWSINVTLVRATRGLAEKRHSKAKSTCVPSRSSESTFLPLLDYILGEDKFPTYERFLRCFEHPYAHVLQTEWAKKDSPRAGAEQAFEEAEIWRRDGSSEECMGPGGPGTWMPYSQYKSRPCSASEPSTPCQAGGEAALSRLEDAFLSDASNVQRGMQHVFVPFACRPRFLPAAEARECVSQQRLTLAGDSRTLHLSQGYATWLGAGVVDFVPLHEPLRLGLLHALASKAGKALRTALRGGHTVVINTVLHDVAQFYSTTAASDIMMGWSRYVTCPVSACAGNSKSAAECGCSKKWAVEAYVEAILQLRGAIAAAGREAEKRGRTKSRVYWISLHKRPPAPGDVHYEWQTADVVRELEDYAARELESVGVEHIDLRWMTGAAPGGWWDDAVHFGKQPHSVFMHGVLQAILSRVCKAT